MLNSLSKFARTWFGKVFFAFLLVGLAGFGISGVITNFGSNTVASVGGEDISVREFQRAYNNQMNTFSSQLGTVPTADQALAFGIPQQVIGRLSAEAALNVLTRDFGLGVSDDRLAEYLRQDPAFGDVLGSFDTANFQRILQLNGFTENEFFNTQRDAARRQQLQLAVFGGAPMPETAQRLAYRYGADRRTIEYFTISSNALLPVAEPTEEEMAAYLTENQADFRTRPTRSVKLMVLSPEEIAETLEVSDAEIAADYERTKASYLRRETRDVRQVVLSADGLVSVFEAGIEDGKSFDELVAETGLPVTDFGTVGEGELTDPNLAEAAFSLEEGGVTLIPAPLGMRAVTVSNIQPGGQASLDEVRDEIAEKLRTREARDSFVDVLDQIEELRAAFRPIEEIASRYQLDLHEIDVTADGTVLAGIEGIPADGRTKVADAIFDAEMGSLAPTVSLGANRNVWFDLVEENPARDQALDEVREQVRTAIMNEREDAALQEQVDEVLAALDAGTPFADVAVARTQFPQLSQPFTRNGDGTPVINANVATAAFNGGVGFTGAAQNGDGDYVVFEVTDITPAEGEIQPQTRDVVDNAISESIYAAFLTALRDDAGVRINQNVVNQVIGLDGTQ